MIVALKAADHGDRPVRDKRPGRKNDNDHPAAASAVAF